MYTVLQDGAWENVERIVCTQFSKMAPGENAEGMVRRWLRCKLSTVL
jgi:hypothetical protein